MDVELVTRMDVQIKKWGNSIGLRIPYKVAEQLGFEEDSTVELTMTTDGLIIKKKLSPSNLDELLASIPDDFQYPDDVADFVDSQPVGQEQL
ncbi:MAG: AbrB/MazE/SpoVT family DNA-binding domain-containing protein [Cyanobacteria bacterium J06581_3]